jgi:hypothetical protein
MKCSVSKIGARFAVHAMGMACPLAATSWKVRLLVIPTVGLVAMDRACGAEAAGVAEAEDPTVARTGQSRYWGD